MCHVIHSRRKRLIYSTSCLIMATATTPVGQDQPNKTASPPVVFDLSQPPVIEGFTPLPRAREENFKDKFIRKTKENPFVPIGELHKAVTYTSSTTYIIWYNHHRASYDLVYQQLNTVKHKMQRVLNGLNVYMQCHSMETSLVMHSRWSLASYGIFWITLQGFYHTADI